MIYNTFEMHQEGSLPGAHLVTYIQEYSEAMAINDRPLILLCPGGGYTRTSDREAEPMALKFLAMGYHAAVLRYSCAPAEYPTSLKELAYSIKFLREHAKEWHIDPHKIVVEGCSAGGHLAASLGVFWDEDFLAESQGLSASEHELLRPDGLLLCYPVITSGEFAHRGSFENLLGSRQEDYLEIISSCSGRLISIYDVFIVDNLILLLMQCSFGFQTISKQFLSFFGRNNTRNTIFNDNRIFFGKYGCIFISIDRKGHRTGHNGHKETSNE